MTRYSRAALLDLVAALEANPGHADECFAAWQARNQLAPKDTTVTCTLCGSIYARRNPGAHFRSQRHVAAVPTGSEYCAGECKTHRRARVPGPPTPRPSSTIDWRQTRRIEGAIMCLLCGGAVVVSSGAVEW